MQSVSITNQLIPIFPKGESVKPVAMVAVQIPVDLEVISLFKVTQLLNQSHLIPSQVEPIGNQKKLVKNLDCTSDAAFKI